MKTKMKKQIMLTAVFYMAVLGTSVAQHDHSSHMKSEMDGDMVMVKKYDVDVKFQDQLKGVMEANQILIEAFSNDNADAIKSATTKFTADLTKVDMSLLSGEAHHTWMKYSKEMKKAAEQINNTDDVGFQRIQLAKLDEALYKSLKSFGTGGIDVYYNYCPMANDVGANWLTTSSEIQNPFMGQKMPKCGSNKEVLN
jgi:Cu(I)/Ag(I) efflux system membrane fusion protein